MKTKFKNSYYYNYNVLLVFPCSLTIVAENLASLQQQVRLKDSEIERLNQELETLRQEHQLQLDQAQVQQDHRPPPDVTQYQSAQPDIAAVRQPSVQQPDLMPGIGFQVNKKNLSNVY